MLVDYDAKLLVPRLKTTDFVQSVANIPHADRPIVEPFAGDLVLSYAFDTPSTFVMASPKSCAQAGVTAADVRLRATANLLQRIDQIGVQQILDSVVGLTAGENMSACLMLVDAIWEGLLAKKIDGPIVAAVPHRDVLLACAQADARVLATVLEGEKRERQTVTDPHSLSTQLYVRQNRRWYPFHGAS